jgi:ectoine hydroxylase-related dioxygenase (phytanoyl-CoA dioxygenase family)
MSAPLSPQEKRELDDVGFIVLPDFFNDLLVPLRARIEAILDEEGDRAGWEFKQEAGSRRLANLVDKGTIFQQVIGHPRLMPYVHHVLGERFKLSSLNARSVNPFSTEPQPLHADMAAIADDTGFWVCNTVWMIDDITSANGPIRAIPGSHHLRKLPSAVLADPQLPHADEVLITGKAGTVVVMNAHVWHGGLGNHTPRARTALHAFYCRHDKPQQQYQKQLLRPEVQESLSSDLRGLLALDDPENDELSSKPRVLSGFLKG